MAAPSGRNSTVELSIPLPRSLDTRIHLRLSTRAKAITLFLTTASQDEMGSTAPMGSFVYALPNRLNQNEPLATTLFSHEPTIEFTTRLAKLLARKTQTPVYVTNSVSFANAGMGGTVEEEIEGLKAIAEVTLANVSRVDTKTPLGHIMARHDGDADYMFALVTMHRHILMAAETSYPIHPNFSSDTLASSPNLTLACVLINDHECKSLEYEADRVHAAEG